MILRSVTKHVKDQNWFAVLLDFLIVVIGVFIGIQVANWNEEIEAKKQTKVLVERLYGDLKNEQETFSNLLNYQTVVRQYALTAVDALKNKGNISDKQLVISAYQASQISLPWNYRATYDEMLSTGKINLIKSQQLKDMILGYYSDNWAKQSNMLTTAPYRKIIRGLISIPIQDAIKSECGDVNLELAHTFGAALPTTCDLQLTEESFHDTAGIIRSYPDILYELQYQIAFYDAQVNTLANFELETHKLMATIKAYQP